MAIAPYVPVIVEATKFVFNEIEKWIDHVRKKSENKELEPSQKTSNEVLPTLTYEDFAVLEKDMPKLLALINAQLAETNAYEVKGLVEQIQIHRRSLVDFEKAEAEMGVLVPPHIKRGIEREATSITEKASRLKELLEQIYGRRIESE